jgi:hypothetical protein
MGGQVIQKGVDGRVAVKKKIFVVQQMNNVVVSAKFRRAPYTSEEIYHAAE